MKLEDIRRALNDCGAIRIVSWSQNRALVLDHAAHAYLLHFLSSKRPVTPGRVDRRIRKWAKHSGREIVGHLVLSDGEASVNLEKTIVADIPTLCIVTAFSSRRRQLFVSADDETMTEIVRAFGVAETEAVSLAHRETLPKHTLRARPPKPAPFAQTSASANGGNRGDDCLESEGPLSGVQSQFAEMSYRWPLRRYQRLAAEAFEKAKAAGQRQVECLAPPKKGRGPEAWY